MNIKELLSPDVDLSSLQAKAEELFAAIEAKQRSIKNVPEGRLRIAQRVGSAYYYHVTESTPEWGDYLPLAEAKTIARLAQKEYDHSILAEMQRQLKILDRFLKSFCPQRLHDLFTRMLPARKKFVQPVHFPDEEYASRWLAVKYDGKPISSDAPQLFTSRGEQVRSKSEVIIADTLSRLKIPYRYEFPYQMKIRGHRRATEFHPDFTCLNIATRREFIWEHFGLMDDPAYATATCEKFKTYVANGIFLGERLLFTMETQERPLNPATVEALARKYLQPL